jgi:hypothetical protein
MFVKIIDALSGSDVHINKLYSSVTLTVGPQLPGNPQVLTMFFVLMRGISRVVSAGRGPSMLALQSKELLPTAIIELMDFHSGLMRRAAQMGLVTDFDLLDRLAHQIFPHTAANSLALFDFEGDLMQSVPIERRMFGPSWEGLAMAYIGGSLGLTNVNASLNKPQVEAFLSDGVSLLQSDVDVVVRGDPMGAAM